MASLNKAIEDAGESSNVNVHDLAKRLERQVKSVIDRIGCLKRNGGLQKVMRFTLVEDIMVLERLVIPRVGKEKLAVVLRKQHYAELTKHLKNQDMGF